MAKGMLKKGSLPQMQGESDDWSHTRVIGTGHQIRAYLQSHGSDYPMNIWRALKKQDEQFGYTPPSWPSFMNYFARLRKLNLVIEDRRGASVPSTAHPSTENPEVSKLVKGRTVPKAYTLNPSPLLPKGVSIEEAWRNPQAALWNWYRKD